MGKGTITFKNKKDDLKYLCLVSLRMVCASGPPGGLVNVAKPGANPQATRPRLTQEELPNAYSEIRHTEGTLPLHGHLKNVNGSERALVYSVPAPSI